MDHLVVSVANRVYVDDVGFMTQFLIPNICKLHVVSGSAPPQWKTVVRFCLSARPSKYRNPKFAGQIFMEVDGVELLIECVKVPIGCQ